MAAIKVRSKQLNEFADGSRQHIFGFLKEAVRESLRPCRVRNAVTRHLEDSLGALAVAPSDPKPIYVGTGQVTLRYDEAAGEAAEAPHREIRLFVNWAAALEKR